MIDLETLAENRAKELGQSEKEWVESLKQPAFNEFSTYLSDGEVEMFLRSVVSPVGVALASGALLSGYREGDESAYLHFLDLIEPSHLSLSQGLDFLCQTSQWEKTQNRKLSFQEKLEFLRKFIQENQDYELGADLSKWMPNQES